MNGLIISPVSRKECGVLYYLITMAIPPQKVFLLFIFIHLSLLGCATTMVMIPSIVEIENVLSFRIKGRIIYDNNKKYLPRTIDDESVSDPILSFKYIYKIAYGRDQTPQALYLFNPFSLIGFPIGENTLVVTGILTIFKGKEEIKEYKSTCGLERQRSLFSEGDTFSELREKGLLAVRNNIEAQMYQDRQYLSKVIRD
jgi:hypothetical protein